MMRIAFFTASPPVPPTSGYQLRCHHLAKALLRDGHELHLFSFDPITRSEREERRTQRVSEAVSEGLGVPSERVCVVENRPTTVWAAARALLSPLPFHVFMNRRRDMERAIRDSSPERFDAVYMNLMYFMEYRQLFRPDALVIVDQHNLDRDVWRGLATRGRGVHRRAYALVNLIKTRAYERFAYNQTDVCVSCARRDLEGTARISKHPRLVLAPNGVEVTAVKPPTEAVRSDASPLVLLVGGPSDKNLAAVERLYYRILPLIRVRVPDVRLRIAGRVGDSIRGAIRSDPHVEIVGPLDDISSAYKGAWVFAAPFTYGGGTKLKILEAYAAGVPLVGTTNAVQGIDLTGCLGEYIADDDVRFSELVVTVLQNETIATRLSRDGRELAVRYRWDAAIEPVLGELRRHAEISQLSVEQLADSGFDPRGRT